MRQPLFPHLSGFFSLADRVGVDIEPTLLRVLTDLYIQKPAHSAEEERHFCELALRLIPVVDDTVRAEITAKLMRYPAAPALVMERLVPGAYRPPSLPPQDASAMDDPLSAIAQRLRAHLGMASPEKEILAPLPQTAQRSTLQIASAMELNEIFFTADAAERRLILLALDYSLVSPAALAPLADEGVHALERAALSQNAAPFTNALARALHVSPAQAARLAQDPLGEPLIVATKALGVPLAITQRIMMVANPAIGRSVALVYDLSALYEEISLEVALRLATIWQCADRAGQRPAHHPLHWDDEKHSARHMATPAARREGQATEPAANRERARR